MLEGRNSCAREAALKALEKVKQLETVRHAEMVSIRVDNRTVVSMSYAKAKRKRLIE